MKRLLIPLVIGLSLSTTAIAKNNFNDNIFFTNATTHTIYVYILTTNTLMKPGPATVLPLSTQFIPQPSGAYQVGACFKGRNDECTFAGSTECPQESPDKIVAAGGALTGDAPHLKCISES